MRSRFKRQRYHHGCVPLGLSSLAISTSQAISTDHGSAGLRGASQRHCSPNGFELRSHQPVAAKLGAKLGQIPGDAGGVSRGSPKRQFKWVPESFNLCCPLSLISQTPRGESALSRPSRIMLFRVHWAALCHRGLSWAAGQGFIVHRLEYRLLYLAHLFEHLSHLAAAPIWSSTWRRGR